MTDWTHDGQDAAAMSPGDPARYLESGRRLQARAMGEALAATFGRLAGRLSRVPLWRAPQSGNCLNC